MTTDFLSLIATHYDELHAFARAFLRDRKTTADFLRRAAPALQEGFPASLPAAGFSAWARERLAAALRDAADPLRRPATLAALAEAFERRRDRPPLRAELLDRAIQALSQDAQPPLTARYENDLSVETVAWRFRTSPANAMAALSRIRRLLIKELLGAAPNARFDELLQKHLEGAASRIEREALAARVTERPEAADAFADACLLDADLSLYFTQDPDAPDEGASLAVRLADRTTSPRSSPARRPGRARSRT
jgi:DNA-directed RNA polymerase specialized sigma24 family protein